MTIARNLLINVNSVGSSFDKRLLIIKNKRCPLCKGINCLLGPFGRKFLHEEKMNMQ